MPYWVLTTTESEEEAEGLGRRLVKDKLAACTNIVSGVKSIYRWEGEIEESEESLLIIKTTEENLQELKEKVVDIHSYETPELLAVSIDDGLKDYLDWLEKSVD